MQPAAVSSPSASPSSTLRSGWTRFDDASLGLSFDYPTQWGTVSVTPEIKRCFANGEGHIFQFSNLATVGATMRSNDYVWSLACGRGGIYSDSPARYGDMANMSDKAWDPIAMSGRWITKRASDRLIEASCNVLLNIVGMGGWVRLGAQKYDVIHFYQQLRPPRANGGGVDVTGCDRGAELFTPISADFTDVVNSVRMVFVEEPRVSGA